MKGVCIGDEGREREGEREGEKKRKRREERLTAAEKAAFGLAGLTHFQRYTATNDDVSLPLRKRNSTVLCIQPGLETPLL